MISRPEIISFDCYGTLINWEKGICDALFPYLFSKEDTPDRDKFLAAYARFESEAEKGPYRSYRKVLYEVCVRMFEDFAGLAPHPESEMLNLLSDSLPFWPPFPDTVDALRILGAKCPLAIISNVDEDLIRGTLRQLDVPFAHIITAESVRAYKPSLAGFEAALGRFGVRPDRVLHCGCSKYHDIRSASQMGMKTVWVDRRRGEAGSGASPEVEAQADYEVGSLKELAEQVY